MLHVVHVASDVFVHGAAWYEPALHAWHDWHTVLDPTVQAEATNSSAPQVEHAAHTVSAFVEHARLAHVLPAVQVVHVEQEVSDDRLQSLPMYWPTPQDEHAAHTELLVAVQAVWR